MIRVNSLMLCYLTPEARNALNSLKDKGVDEDLALTLLETLLPESDVYHIEDDANGPATC
jgi:hypothetical protein